jgi:hypothetical protein
MSFEKYSMNLRIGLELVVPDREEATDRAMEAWYRASIA